MDLKEYFKKDKFGTLNDMELIEYAPGYAKTRMVVSEKHCNAIGFCQGGALFTLADLAFAAAVNSHGTATVAVSSNISFVRSAKVGETVYAEAHEIIDHWKLPYAEVRITNEEGTLLAILTSTGYRKAESLEFRA